MLLNINVTQMQLRNALIDLAMYDQWDSNYISQTDRRGYVYWTFSPTIDSDSPHFTELTTSYTEAQRYDAFLLAQTL